MKKSDNKVINLFEQSSIGTKALVITESLKMKRGGSLTRPVLAMKHGESYLKVKTMLL